MEVSATSSPTQLREVEASDRRAAVTAGFLGWTLDAFDFFLVVFTLTAIGPSLESPMQR
jgi:hypothetical protein